jgi:hypothetical protein
MISFARQSVIHLGKIGGRRWNKCTRRSFSGSKLWKEDNGTKEMVFGGVILLGVLAVVIDDELQRRQREEFFNHLKSMKDTRSEKEIQEKEDWYKMPTLFNCIVRRKVSNFDGHKSLKGIHEGDLVQVLEENVGPGKLYTLCRHMDKNGRILSVGWYPTMCLEKA